MLLLNRLLFHGSNAGHGPHAGRVCGRVHRQGGLCFPLAAAFLCGWLPWLHAFQPGPWPCCCCCHMRLVAAISRQLLCCLNAAAHCTACFQHACPSCVESAAAPAVQPASACVCDAAERHGVGCSPTSVASNSTQVLPCTLAAGGGRVCHGATVLSNVVSNTVHICLQVVDVFAMPQSGTGVSVEAVDPVFQTKMLDMLKQVGR